jgi:ribonuclease G
VVQPTARAAGSRGAGRDRAGATAPGDSGRAAERTSKRSRGRRAPADSEDAEVRREAGLSDSPTGIDSEPEDELPSGAEDGQPVAQDEGSEDGLQSKPRRRGRRGGRRRSAAKAKATPE